MSDSQDISLDSPALLCYILTVMALKREKSPLKVDFSKQFEEVVQWAHKYKTKVVLDKGIEDRFEPSENTIYINSRNHPETKYYTLLHEAGHLLIDKNWQAFDRDNPMYSVSTDSRGSKSKAYRVSLVAEEIEAWKRGRRLAKRMGHQIDEKKYDKHTADNVMTYIEWAATGGDEL